MGKGSAVPITAHAERGLRAADTLVNMDDGGLSTNDGHASPILRGSIGLRRTGYSFKASLLINHMWQPAFEVFFLDVA